MQGNCRNLTDVSETRLWPLESDQCLVLLNRDFLEVDLDEDSHVWVSGLYLQYDVGHASDTIHKAVLSSARSNLYLTDLTISAEGYTAGAVDVYENQTVFVAGLCLCYLGLDQCLLCCADSCSATGHLKGACLYVCMHMTCTPATGCRFALQELSHGRGQCDDDCSWRQGYGVRV